MNRVPRDNSQRPLGLTLMELLVVLMVLIALVGIAVPLLSGVSDSAKEQATLENLRRLQQVLLDRYRIDMQGEVSSSNPLVLAGLPGPDADHLQPSGRNAHPQLRYLFVNPALNSATSSYDPVRGRGWRGPYFLTGRNGRYPGWNPQPDSRGFGAQFGEPDDETVLDGWGNPIIIQLGPDGIPELVSAGPDGSLQIEPNLTVPLP